VDEVLNPTLRARYAAASTRHTALSLTRDRDAAVATLAAIVKAEPDAAEDVFLVAQDDKGQIVGETIYGSSLAAAA
jgi:hypothetical protein